MDTTLVNKKRIKVIWSLAWPLMISQILQTLLQIVDMWFISRIEINTVSIIAAVGYGTSILGVIIVFSQLIATGSLSLIARKTGEKDDREVLNITEQSLLLAFFVGMLISLICYYFSEEILYIFGVEGIVKDYAIIYFKIVLIGVPFTFFNLTGRAILQSTGDSKTPMMIFILMNIINILLDPILIFGFSNFKGFGFSGAATATTISNIIAFIFMVFFLGKRLFKGDIKKVLANFKIDVKTMANILKIGFFSAIQAVSRPITGIFMYRIASYSGTNAVAAFTVGGRMFNLVFIFLMGLNMSVSVLVGQNIGKRNKEEAKGIINDGVKLGFLNTILFLIPYFLFAKYLMAFFVDDIDVINIGVNYLRITYIGVIFVVFQVVYGGAFVGAGKTMPPMIASIISNWGFKLPFAYIFSKILNLGANFVWIAISLSVIVESIIIIIWFKKNKIKEIYE